MCAKLFLHSYAKKLTQIKYNFNLKSEISFSIKLGFFGIRVQEEGQSPSPAYMFVNNKVKL